MDSDFAVAIKIIKKMLENIDFDRMNIANIPVYFILIKLLDAKPGLLDDTKLPSLKKIFSEQNVRVFESHLGPNAIAR